MSEKSRKIIDKNLFRVVVKRLAHSLLEKHDFSNESVIVGMQPRGIYLSNYIIEELKELGKGSNIQKAILDHTFFRDDFREQDQILTPNNTDISISIEDKKIVLIDDVLYTGRSVRSGIEALMTLGRPKSIELLVLVDRRFHRQLPIESNYTGVKVDAMGDEKVEVRWGKNYSFAEAYINK